MTWREPQPTDVPEKPMQVNLDPDLTQPSEKALSTAEVEGEPDTIEDEFAKDDAPDQEYEDDI
jgi:hypothetical protein